MYYNLIILMPTMHIISNKVNVLLVQFCIKNTISNTTDVKPSLYVQPYELINPNIDWIISHSEPR